MERFKALNVENDESEDIDHTLTTEKLTNELKAEYLRALKLKQNGQYDISIEILQKILATKEIEETDVQHNELFSLKYACYKNLAELFESKESYHCALEYFLKAFDMNDTDVFFMNKFGYVALKEEYIDLAHIIFERCLKSNPNHRPSYDGVLDAFCSDENYFEAYGWSVLMHSKFPNYQRPIDVILDVRDLFKHTTMLENAFTPINDYKSFKRSSRPSDFPPASYVDLHEKKSIDMKKFKVKSISLVNFGRMIESVCKMSDSTYYFDVRISLNDICNIDDLNKIESFDDSAHSSNQSVPRSIRNPTPIIEIFQEIVPQYFSDRSEDEVQIIDHQSILRTICQPGYFDNTTNYAINEELLHSHLLEFIDALKSESFSMTKVVYQWLKCMSKCSHLRLPIELQSLYIAIYDYQSNYFEWEIWNERVRLGNEYNTTGELFQMSLLYMELKIATNLRSNYDKPRFFDKETINRFYKMFFMKNLSNLNSLNSRDEVRFILIHYQLAIQQMNYELAMNLLYSVQEFFEKNTSLNVYLPNQCYFTLISPAILTNEMDLLACLQRLKLIAKGFSNKQLNDDDVKFLRKCQQHRFDCEKFPSHYQLELLVEHYWMTDHLEDCLYWCEKGLHDAMIRWQKMTQQDEHTILHQLPSHTKFLIIYLEHLFRETKLSINLLNEKKDRFIQNMAHLFEAQCDHRFIEHQIKLFNSYEYVNVLYEILKIGDQTGGSQLYHCNIIVNVAKWLILNNVSLPNNNDDCNSGIGGTFLRCAWNTLHYVDDETTLKFNRTEIIQLLSHSMFGYPKHIKEHHAVCTCIPSQIDWNGISLIFASFDRIKNGMTESELAMMINDLLNAVPNDVHIKLCDAIDQLDLFLSDTADFPHKLINTLKLAFPHDLKDIFYRFVHTIDSKIYDRYTREQMIQMDLVLNSKRLSSWLILLNIKICRMNTVFNTVDLTKLNIVEVEKLENAVDTCYDKCEILNEAESITANYYYGLHIYRMHNFYMKANGLRDEFSYIHSNGTVAVAAAKRFAKSTNWMKAKQMLWSYLNGCTTKNNSLARSKCYFVLGKIAEKENPTSITSNVLEYYLLAEQELYDHQNDVDFQLIKLEINFRITVCIYKIITHTTCVTDGVIDEKIDSEKLLQVLKRKKDRLFNDNELLKRQQNADAEIFDENFNRINGDMEIKQQYHNEIIRLCTFDFEWYLELNPSYYKAAYYLAKIHFNQKNELKCRALLLQLPRKNNEQDKKMSLFDIHRNRNLFKIKKPIGIETIHNLVSFNKYMEKCLNILIKYLETTPNNWYSQLVLVFQFIKLTKNSTDIHLKLHQKQRLFTVIWMNFIRSATTYVNKYSRSTAKSQAFLDFYMKTYELHGMWNVNYIDSVNFEAYSNLLIECYRRYGDDVAVADADATDAEQNTLGKSNNLFQLALDFCAKESDKIRKKPTVNQTKSDKSKPITNPTTSNSNKMAKQTKPKLKSTLE